MDNFSNMMIIGECLLDGKRVALFKKAINKMVKPGDVVLDGGTGSGIMAILSAKAKAKKVVAVEINKDVSMWAKGNVCSNKFSNIVEVVNRDLKKIKLPKINVVVMEMLDTALIAEQQVPALNNLIKSKAVDKHTKFIPSEIKNYIQFCDYDFNFYSVEMPFIIQARNSGVKKRIKNKISEKILINEIKLNEVNKLDQNISSSFTVKKSGKINAFVIYSWLELCPGVSTWETSDMNMPVIIPVECRNVVEGQELKFNLYYKISHGFGKLKFTWVN